MDTNYYSDSGESSDTPSAGGAEESTPDDNKPETKTALLPKSFFGDKELEIGSECKVKVEHVYEDEVEVSYVPMDESSKPEMDNAMAGMDQMVGDESED